QIPADAALVLWIDDLGEPLGCVLRRHGPPVWVRLTGRGKDGAWTEQDRALPRKLYHLLRRPPSPRQSVRQREQSEQRDLIEALGKQRLQPLQPHLAGGNGQPAVRRLFVVPTGWAALVPL